MITEEQKAEVRQAMEVYGTAYQKKDVKAFSALFSPDISGFGSGPDEVIRNHDDFIRQIRRDMSQATVTAVDFTETEIFGDGRIAWVTTKSTIQFTLDGSTKHAMQGRSTMVLKNTGNRWIFEQIHFSMPFGEQAKGQSFPGA